MGSVADSPNYLTKQQARDLYYPEARVEDMRLFYISYFREGQDDAWTDYLWFDHEPTHDELMEGCGLAEGDTIMDCGLEEEGSP